MKMKIIKTTIILFLKIIMKMKMKYILIFTGNISVIQNCNNTTIKNNKIILLIGLLIVVLA